MATEAMSAVQAEALLEQADNWVRKVVARLDFLLPGGSLRVLDLGAAQGRMVRSLELLGHRAWGLEPYPDAIRAARDLAAHRGVDARMVRGEAERLPFRRGTFDLVLAFSVMEHTSDLDLSLREIARVTRPGGVFWFSSASAMCPRQYEIRGFPGFGWYPLVLKRRIMMWARDRRPDLVHDTLSPALHWWTPRVARRALARAGFEQVRGRWLLRLPTEDIGLRRAFVRCLKRSGLLRRLADLAVPGCSFAAVRSGGPPGQPVEGA